MVLKNASSFIEPFDLPMSGVVVCEGTITTSPLLFCIVYRFVLGVIPGVGKFQNSPESTKTTFFLRKFAEIDFSFFLMESSLQLSSFAVILVFLERPNKGDLWLRI